MNKAKAIGIELAIAAGIAVCLGTLIGGGGMIHGRNPLVMLQPLFAGALWLAPCLAVVWITRDLPDEAGRTKGGHARAASVMKP